MGLDGVGVGVGGDDGVSSSSSFALFEAGAGVVGGSCASCSWVVVSGGGWPLDEGVVLLLLFEPDMFAISAVLVLETFPGRFSMMGLTSTSAATSMESFTSWIVAIMFSNSTATMASLPSGSLVVVMTFSSMPRLLLGSWLLFIRARLVARHVTPNRAAALRDFLMLVVSLYPRSVP